VPVRPGTVSAPLRYEFNEGRLVSGIRDDDPFLAPDIDRAYAPVALREAMATLHADCRIAYRGPDCPRRGVPRDGIHGPGRPVDRRAGRRDRLVVTVSPMAEAETAVSKWQNGSFPACAAGLNLCAAVQWAEHPDRGVTWANAAYLGLCEEAETPGHGTLNWPLPRLFGDQLDPPPTDGKQRRCHLTLGDKSVMHWFEVSATGAQGAEVLFSARAIDKLVTAETSLRDFVQTLSKTFATLPVGLAVFDRSRELVLFNPALISVTMLEAAS
jgi:hypothetical protein